MKNGRNYRNSCEVKMGKVIVMTTEVIPSEIEKAADFFNKVMSACRDLRTFQLMEDELRKIMSAPMKDYRPRVERGNRSDAFGWRRYSGPRCRVSLKEDC
jgi:hypothetical protein